LTVLHPLKLRGLEASITPPAYTRRPPNVSKQGNLQAIEGSKVSLKVTLDRAPARAEITISPAKGQSAPQIIRLQLRGAELTADLPALTEDVRYELTASAADGMQLDPTRYEIRVKPDGKPTVRFVRPKDSIAALPTTEVPMQVDASDDFGIAKAGIAYKV